MSANSPAMFTKLAGQAMDFATRFNAFFQPGLPGPVHHHVDLTLPAGPSTESGKQALQHLRLLPEGGGSTIVIGSVHCVDKTVEVRSLRALADVHAARFSGSALPIEAKAYDELLVNLRSFFETEGFRFTVADVSPAMAPPADVVAPRSSRAMLFVLLGLALVAVLAVVSLKLGRVR